MHRFTPEEIELAFWGKVLVVENCWEWLGSCLPSGYGGFQANQRRIYAHRYSYERFVGPIPDGYQIDHLCKNTRCVNPAHLEAVTPRTNCLRSSSFAAQQARQTHCKYGHPFDEANTAYYRRNMRTCRECGRRRCSETQARAKQKKR